jgi:lipopolysaccharide/colanic/teichoic acid biosynthesis glycosyltransferase
MMDLLGELQLLKEHKQSLTNLKQKYDQIKKQIMIERTTDVVQRHFAIVVTTPICFFFLCVAD